MAKLTVGMACWDDVEGCFWCLSILRQFHVPYYSDLRDKVDLLVVDDMPTEQRELRHLCNLAGARYVHKPKAMGPAHGKASVFEESATEYTLLLDSHVLCLPGSIQYLLDAIDRDEIGNDIWSGPLVSENGGVIATELLPKWRGEFWGIWDTDKDIVTKKVKQIMGMGSAFFCMKTKNFVDNECFPKEFKGFGGEELIMSEINRQKTGGQHYCHDALRWQHRFYKPKPVTYALTINDKFKNYTIGFYKCGWDTEAVRKYFSRKLPADQLRHNSSELEAMFPDVWTRNAGGKTWEELD